MKKGFKDTLQEKKGKTIKSPWDFECPPYDERSSCFLNAGTNHGVGKTQNIGKFSAKSGGVIPFGRPSTLKTDEIHRGKPELFNNKST